MQVELLFKIAGIGIMVSVISQILSRTGREDMAMLTTVAGLVIVLLMVVNLVAELFASVKSIFQLY
jgi:stage III sporulation protein AC